MLVQYTSLSALSPEEQARLKVQVRNQPVPSGAFQFEDKVLQGSEVALHKQIWENGSNSNGKQVLLG